MKTRIIILLVSVILLAAPAAVHAVSLGIGGTFWYAGWDPYWNKNSHYTNSYGGLYRKILPSYYHESCTITPAPLYGPALLLSLPLHFKVMSSFIYGEFSGSGSGQGLFMGGMAYMMNRKVLNIRRYDSDSMISYNVTNFFHVFIGFKYIHYDYTINDNLPYRNGGTVYMIVDRIKKKYKEYAPGAGIGFTVPLVKGSFYLLLSGSVIYNLSAYKTSEISLMFGPGVVLPFVPLPMNKSLSKIGCNASAAFAYYIQPIRTTISAGFRYQMFKLTDNDYSESIKQQKRLWEHFYGLTVSAMVNINLTPSGGTDEDS